jgi:hypothetical protein
MTLPLAVARLACLPLAVMIFAISKSGILLRLPMSAYDYQAVRGRISGVSVNKEDETNVRPDVII